MNHTSRRGKRPPQVSQSPLRQLWLWNSDQVSYLLQCQSRYGDYFDVNVAGIMGRVSIVASPHGAKGVFALPDRVADRANSPQSVLSPIVGESSLFLKRGPDHRRTKSMLSPQLHGTCLREKVPLLQGLITLGLESWTKREEPWDVSSAIRGLSLELMLVGMFDLTSDQTSKVKAALASYLRNAEMSLGTLMFFLPVLRAGWWPYWRAFVKDRDAFRALLKELLETSCPGTFSYPDSMDIEERIDHLLTNFLAGQETISSALGWSIYAAAQFPDQISLLSKETVPSFVKEVLRYYPIIPVGLSRVLKEDIEIEGYSFYQGETLAVAAHLIHRSPAIYSDGSNFKADRFLQFQPEPHEFLPFGGGTRLCIGNEFSLAIMREFWLAVLRSGRTFHFTSAVPNGWSRRGLTMVPPSGLLTTLNDHSVSIASSSAARLSRGSVS